MNFTTYKVNILQKIGVQKVPNCSELKSFCFIKTICAAAEGQHILLIPQMQCNIWSIWPHSLHQLLLPQQEFSCHDSSQEKKRCYQLYMCWLIARYTASDTTQSRLLLTYIKMYVSRHIWSRFLQEALNLWRTMKTVSIIGYLTQRAQTLEDAIFLSMYDQDEENWSLNLRHTFFYISVG